MSADDYSARRNDPFTWLQRSFSCPRPDRVPTCVFGAAGNAIPRTGRPPPRDVPELEENRCGHGPHCRRHRLGSNRPDPSDLSPQEELDELVMYAGIDHEFAFSDK